MRHQRVDLLKLIVSEQPRPLITEAVDKLACSIRDVGLIQPITVRQCSIMSGGLAGQGFQVVAGHHRVAACRALGWTEIDAIVIEAGEHLQAELIEIDENLCRSELTNSQRAKAVKRRKEIWEALHPVRQRFDSGFDALGTVEGPMTEAEEREQVAQVAPPVAKHRHAQEKAFAAETRQRKEAVHRRACEHPAHAPQNHQAADPHEAHRSAAPPRRPRLDACEAVLRRQQHRRERVRSGRVAHARRAQEGPPAPVAGCTAKTLPHMTACSIERNAPDARTVKSLGAE